MHAFGGSVSVVGRVCGDGVRRVSRSAPMMRGPVVAEPRRGELHRLADRSAQTGAASSFGKRTRL